MHLVLSVNSAKIINGYVDSAKIINGHAFLHCYNQSTVPEIISLFGVHIWQSLAAYVTFVLFLLLPSCHGPSSYSSYTPVPLPWCSTLLSCHPSLHSPPPPPLLLLLLLLLPLLWLSILALGPCLPLDFHGYHNDFVSFTVSLVLSDEEEDEGMDIAGVNLQVSIICVVCVCVATILFEGG